MMSVTQRISPWLGSTSQRALHNAAAHDATAGSFAENCEPVHLRYATLVSMNQ